MAIRFLDSFDHYQTAQLTAKWTTVTLAGVFTIVVGKGRCGTNALQGQGTSGTRLTKGVAFSGNTGIVGFALQVTQQQASAVGTTVYIEAAGAILTTLELRRLLDGTFQVYRSDTLPVLLGATVPDVTRVGEWFYVEFRFVLSATVGEVQLHVNGVEVLNLTGQNTIAAVGTQKAGSTPTGVSLATGSNYVWLIDDLYILDATGSVNNTFLGDTRVEYLQPTGNGTHQDWGLVGAASHWQAVDDGDSPDDDATYIDSFTVGEQDTEVYANTGLPSGTIFAVQTNLYARKTDSGFREVQPVIRSAGSDYVGGSHAPSFASYVYLSDVFETDPATGVAWTISGVNGAEYGVRVSV